MYKDKEAQKAANRAAKARWKTKQGIPEGIPEQGIPGYSVEGIPATFRDACGNEHPIDYAGRRKDWLLLRDWRNSKGTAYQYRMGTLAAAYGKLHGEYDKPANLARYLGTAEAVAGGLLAKTGTRVN